MPVRCYQVTDFSYDDAHEVLTVSTVTMAPSTSNIEALLRLVAPSIVSLGRSADLFDQGERYQVRRSEAAEALELLKQHTKPRVTPITPCDLSVCLDFYRHPEDDSAARWIRTPTGSLVYRAKYGDELRLAGPMLAELALRMAPEHPVLRGSDAVVAVPSSHRLVYGVARTVADAMSLPMVALVRTRQTAQPQKALNRGDNLEGNQSGTMDVDGSCAGRVLVIDDFMRDGSTVTEADRALRAAGAAQTVSLTLVKQRTGTAGYYFGEPAVW